jgi:hypothetical protein
MCSLLYETTMTNGFVLMCSLVLPPFLEDSWLGMFPSAPKYPSLYCIAERKQISVADIPSKKPLNETFRRTQTPNKWEQ